MPARISVATLFSFFGLFSLLTLAPPAHAAPLSFDAAVALATQHASQIQMARARLDAERQAAIPAGELPDPKLDLAIDNFPVGGPARNSLTQDFMTMRRIGISQEMPNQDKREARVAAAQARIARSEFEQRATELMVQREAASAWIKRYTLEQQLAQLDLMQQENRRFAATVGAQLAQGKLAPADSLLPRLEAAQLAGQIDELQAARTQAIAALRRWVGAAAEEPLLGQPRSWQLQQHELAQVVHRRPELLALEANGRVLDAEVREAQAGKKPDWALGFAYQKRGAQFGDMISLQWSIDLPLQGAKRQDPQIAAKILQRAGLEFEREALRAEHSQMLANDWAELERITRALERNRSTLQALAQEKLALTLAGYRANRATLQDVMLARRDALEVRLKQIMLEGELALLNSQLHFANIEHAGVEK